MVSMGSAFRETGALLIDRRNQAANHQFQIGQPGRGVATFGPGHSAWIRTVVTVPLKPAEIPPDQLNLQLAPTQLVSFRHSALVKF